MLAVTAINDGMLVDRIRLMGDKNAADLLFLR